MVYVGMDVHRKRTQVAVLDERGAEVLNRNLPNDPDELTPLLMSLGDDVSVVFEAAYGWGDPHYEPPALPGGPSRVWLGGT